MTGQEWSEHFETLSPARKNNLRRAMRTLRGDPLFAKAFGMDFRQLEGLLKYPLPKVIYRAAVTPPEDPPADPEVTA